MIGNKKLRSCLAALPLYLRKSCAFPLCEQPKLCGCAALFSSRRKDGGIAAEPLVKLAGKAELFRK
jgi:hypothetical protein